jgi:parvulin-like peptidyl-prolyl isomerase
LTEEVNKEDPPTDEEISEYYEENKDGFVSPAAVSASHILMNDPEHTATTRAAIEAVLEKAKAGEDFAELAKQYSEDGTAVSGGALGTFAQDGTMVAEFEDAAFELEPGEISDIVESEYGFHIIKVFERQDEQQLTLEESKEDITEALQSEHLYNMIEELKDTFTIEYLVDVDPETGEPPLEMDVEDEDDELLLEEDDADFEDDELILEDDESDGSDDELILEEDDAEEDDETDADASDD